MSATPTGPIKVEFAVTVDESQLPKLMNAIQKATGETNAYSQAMKKIAADSQQAVGVTQSLTGGLNQFNVVSAKSVTVLNSLGQSVNSSISNMGALSGAVAKLGNAGAPVSVVNGQLQLLGSTAHTTTSKLQAMGERLSDNVGSFSLAAISVFSLYNALQNLERLELQTERVTINADRLRNTLTIATLRYNKALEGGKLTQEQAAAQAERLNIMHERSAVATAIAKHAAEELTAAYAGFATQVLPMLVVAGGSVISMFKDMNIGVSTIKNAIGGFKDIIGDIPKLMKAGITGAGSALGGLGGGGATAAASKLMAQATNEATVALQALNTGMKSGVTSAAELSIAQIQAAMATGTLDAALLEQKLISGGVIEADAKRIAMTIASIPATNGATGATIGLTAATRALGMAMLSLLANPVFLILAGAVAAAGAIFFTFERNVFGVRTAMKALGESIGNAIPFLKPLLQGLEGVADWLGKISGIRPEIENVFTDEDLEKVGKMGEGVRDVTDDSVTAGQTMTSSFGGATKAIESDAQKMINAFATIPKETNFGDVMMNKARDQIRAALPQLKNAILDVTNGPIGGSGIAGLLGKDESLVPLINGLGTATGAARDITKALSDAGLELDIVRTKTGEYVITQGNLEVIARKLGITSNQAFKMVSDAVEGTGGHVKALTGTMNSVVIAGKTVTDSLLEDFDKVKGEINTNLSTSFVKLGIAQKNIGEEANQIWPQIQSQLEGVTDPAAFDNWIGVLEASKEKFGQFGFVFDNVIEKVKKLKAESSVPVLDVGASVETMVNKMKQSAKEMENANKVETASVEALDVILTTSYGVKFPALFAKTSENYLKMIANIKSNQLSSTDVDVPVTQGLTVDPNLPQSVSSLQQRADEIRSNTEAWKNMTDAQRDANNENSNFVSSSIDVLGILNGTEESLNKRTEAMIKGKEAAAQLVENTVLDADAVNAEKDALIAADGAFDTHNGMIQDSIANIQARSQAIHGTVEQQQEWNKIQNDSIASVDAEAKAAQNLTQDLFDAVSSIAGMNSEAVQLQSLLNQGASASDSMAISIANLAVQAGFARAQLGALGPTAAQSAVGAAQGIAMAEQFIGGLGQTAASSAAEIKYYIDYLAAYGINAVNVLTKVMGVAVNITNLKTLIGGLFGNIPDIQTINTDIQNVQQKHQKAADKASKDSQKQKIDEKKIREDAVQQAIKEVAMYSAVISKNIDETKAVRDLALEFGVAESALKKYNKQMTEFGTTTDKAQISMLKLTLAQAENLRYLHSQTQATKDLLNAQIDGAKAARDFELDTRKNAIAGKEEQKVLMDITKELGISLPASIKPTVENLHLLIEAAYGSEEALKTLQTSVDKVAEFFHDSIEDAKSAIRDGHFSDFVKRELLFSQGADAFTSKIQVKVETAVKMEDIAEQMKKQLSLINMSPDLFNQNVNDNDVKAGVQTTLDSIKEAISHDPSLAKQWQPIVDGLTSVLSAPDASEALVAFAKKFPDLLGPALTGVTLGMKDLDITMNKTLKDDGKESADILKKGLDDVDASADKIEKRLLKAAKAAQSANKSMSDLGGSLAKLSDIPNFLKGPMDKFKKAQEKAAELRRELELTKKDLANLWETSLTPPKDSRFKGIDMTDPFGVKKRGQTQGPVKDSVWSTITTGLSTIPPAMDKAKSAITVGSGQIVTDIDKIPPRVAQIGTSLATIPPAATKSADDTNVAFGNAWEAIKTNAIAAGNEIGAGFGSNFWTGLNMTWGGIQAANKWIEDNLVIPVTTFPWASSIETVASWGQIFVDTIGGGILDATGWINTNIITPISTFDWAAGIETVAGWGQIFVDKIGQGVLDATGWIDTYIITPVTNYPWATNIETVAGWGQEFVDKIGGGILDATSWIQNNIVTPVTGFDWATAVDKVSEWGQQTVDKIGGAITDATGWIQNNIVTPVTNFTWTNAVDAVKSWGQQTVEVIKGGVKDATGWITTNITSKVTAFNWTSAVATIKKWGAETLAVIATGITSLNTWVTTNITSKLPTSITSSITAIKKWGTDIMKTIADGLPDIGKWVQDNILSKITSAASNAWDAITKGFGSLTGQSVDVSPQVKSEPKTQSALPSQASLAPKKNDQDMSGWQKAARDSMNQVRGEFDDLVNDVRVIFARDLAAATTVAFDGIGKTPETGFNAVRKHFDSLTEDTKTIFKKNLVESSKISFDAMGSTPTKGFTEVRKHFDSLTNDTKTKFKSNLVSSMKTAFDSIGPTAVKGFNDLRKHFDQLISDIKSKFTPALKTAIKNAFDTMATSASGGFDKLIKKFDDLPRAARSAASGIDSAITRITNKNYEVTVTVNQRQGSTVSGASNIDEISNKSYRLSGNSSSSFPSFTESITPSQNSTATFTTPKKAERVDIDKFITSIFKVVDKIKNDNKGSRHITFKGDIIIDGKKLGQYLRQFVLDEIDNQL